MKQRYFFMISVLIMSIKLNSQNLYFPPLTGNTWDSILPSNAGYCQPRIDSLYNYLQAKDTKAFIILKDGKRVLEKYFGTYTRDSAWYWASASKSLAAFITGMAQQQGYVNINNKVSQYLGPGWTSAPISKEDLITVKHLLCMNSGLDDVPPAGCTNEDTARTCLVYKTDASTRWAYHTGAYRKVQDVVSNAVGQNYNIITNNWIKARTGMSGLWFQQVYYSKARDMARFGLLALNKGIWAQDTLMKDSLFFKAMVNSSQSLNQAYGYLWWLNGRNSFMTPQVQFVFNGSLIPNAPAMYCALGKNDQKIYVVPGQKLVVVRQGNTAGGFNLASSAFDNTLWDYINKLSCPVSMSELSSPDGISIYPNPANSHIHIKSTAAFITGAKLYDLQGSLVVSSETLMTQNTVKVDLSTLPAGVYILEIETGNQQIVHKKIIRA